EQIAARAIHAIDAGAVGQQLHLLGDEIGAGELLRRAHGRPERFTLAGSASARSVAAVILAVHGLFYRDRLTGSCFAGAPPPAMKPDSGALRFLQILLWISLLKCSVCSSSSL